MSQQQRSGVIGIVLAEVPTLLGDVIKQAVSLQTDMRIVADAVSIEDVTRAASQTTVDVVVAALSGPDVPLPYQRLLFNFPHAAIIAITASGECAQVYDRNIVRDAAAMHILDAIRDTQARKALSTGPREKA